jgi:hypothetical protein
MNPFRLVVAALSLAVTTTLFAAPLSGTRSIGPTGDYLSISNAIVDIQAQTLGGALVLELQTNYDSTVETFPLVFTNLNTTAVNTLTLRPQIGATNLLISSASTNAATIDLNGAQFVTIDGRPGGVGSNAGSGGGTAAQLTIGNTSSNGPALRFINDAISNKILYIKLQSVNTNVAGGTILFSTTMGANGNDNNTLDHCDLADGVSTPANGIYSLGSTNTVAKNNSGNIVSSCNIFNFYSGSVDAAGVRLEVGSTDWTISSNSFYQTASRAAAAANVQAIYVNNAAGNNFTVAGNSIGGSAPNAGGTAWTTTGTTLAYLFQGIRFNVGTNTPSSVQGNTIANFIWTSSRSSSSLPGVWSGVYVEAGAANIGTVTGNTIGSDTGTDSITVTTSGTGGTTFGIGATGKGTRVIANNTIGSITVNGSSTTISASISGITINNGDATISNNLVGSLTTPNSLNAATSSTSTSGQDVTGILANGISASITGNTVANLNNNYNRTPASFGQVRGIATSFGGSAITGNIVRNLSTTSQNANVTTSQSVLGISATSPSAGQVVAQNIVHSLANTAASAAVSVTGIYYNGPATGTNLIARNWVHSLAVASSSASSVLNGIQFAAGSYTAQNNMVRVGIKADGTSTAGAATVRGIYDQSGDTGRNIYHNSVYLGGTQTSGGSNTRAFQGFAFFARTYQNNIFVNARSNSGGFGRHYAIFYTSTSLTGLTSGGNIFFTSGSGGVLGNYNGFDSLTLADWQADTGQDTSSAIVDPLSIAPTGTAATVDLHLQSSNPAEGGGIALTDALTGTTATLTDDFDGQARGTFTPVDIGADAGNFTLTSDVFAPSIVYTPLIDGSSANRVLNGWATITDNSGSVAGGASAPRLYFKKSLDADVFGIQNNDSGNGWKFVTATGSSPYSFTLDYSLINGGSVSAGDVIEYFVVAQDAANNLASRPLGVTASANPPVQNISATLAFGGVNSFSIVPTFTGTVTVGNGGAYTNLTGTNGLFAAINAGVLTSNVTVNITSDLTETGSAALNQWLEEGGTNFTLTIQPDSATMRTLSGGTNSGLITLNGADRVTIDGSFGGSGRYLTFQNTNSGILASTLRFINDASSNVVRNCVVEGANGVKLSDPVLRTGVIFFGNGTTTGNDNNLITGCQVRDLSTADGVPWVLIGSYANSPTVLNSGNTILNNELFNFNHAGIYMEISGNDSWTLSGNNIYQLRPPKNLPYGIVMTSSGTNVILGNYIHDLLTGQNSSKCGILSYGNGTTTIARNRVTLLNDSPVVFPLIQGIEVEGIAGATINVVNNQVTLNSPNPAVLYGLYDQSTNGSVVNVFHNSFVLGGIETLAGASSSATYRGYAIDGNSSGVHIARNNLFLNFRTGGSNSSHFAASSEASGGSYTASHNVYAGTGVTTNSIRFMNFSTNLYTPAPMNFATWQSLTGDTSTNASNPGGNYSPAMFVNAAAGDLHLVPGGNVLVNGLGTPIPEVTTDFDGNPRSLTAPTIGADEFVSTNQVPVPGFNQLTAQSLGGGTNLLTFLGTPGANYALEMTTNLVSPIVWQPLLTNPAAVNGSLIFTNATELSPLFYRTRFVP